MKESVAAVLPLDDICRLATISGTLVPSTNKPDRFVDIDSSDKAIDHVEKPHYPVIAFCLTAAVNSSRYGRHKLTLALSDTPDY